MKRQDDRTPAQQLTHTLLVVGTDIFLSGWGEAEGGSSYAAWACQDGDAARVESWVRRRGDMSRVRRVIDEPGRRWSPHGRGHYHIYVVDDSHPARA